MLTPTTVGASERGSALGRLALLVGGGLIVYAIAFHFLDRPDTYTRCSPSPSDVQVAEFAERRADYLPLAVPIVSVYWFVLAAAAWQIASRRQMLLGRASRPGRLALVLGVLLSILWAVLISHAFTNDDVGVTVLYGGLLALVGGFASVVLLVALVLHVSVSRADSAPWRRVAIGYAAVLIWTAFLTVWPAVFAAVAIAGKDSTIWC